MAGETISMIKLKQIFLLRLQGTAYETIARSLGEKLFSEPAVVSQYRYQDLESLFPDMEKELKRVGVTRWILWGSTKHTFLNLKSAVTKADHLPYFLARHSPVSNQQDI